MFCIEWNIGNNRQFGFKYKHSTIDAFHVLISYVNWNWNKWFCTGACLLAMEKAFDSVSIQGLVHKLKSLNFPTWLIILIHNMIDERMFFISNGDKISLNIHRIENGIHKGTVNATTLFNIYLLDVVNKTENLVYHADRTISVIILILPF